MEGVRPKRTWKAQMKKRVDNNELNAILTKNPRKQKEEKEIQRENQHQPTTKRKTKHFLIIYKEHSNRIVYINFKIEKKGRR